MSDDPKNPHNIEFLSECLPGSIAEQKELQRIAEFQRQKSLKQPKPKPAKP